jgi:multiple sugar transport system permease protein
LSLKNTAIFTVGVVGLETPLALLIAIVLTRKLRGLALYRAAFFMPAVTSTIAVAVVWSWVFDPQYGIINQALAVFGITGPGWLNDSQWALPAIIIMSIWKNAGYHMVIFLAGLQDIPESYYEAAAIDGASSWQKFRNITWPLLTPTTGFVLITNVIFSFQVFGPVYVMTSGGPMRATSVVVYYLYKRAFQFREMGYASAIAWVLFLIILVLTVLQFRYTRKGVEV